MRRAPLLALPAAAGLLAMAALQARDSGNPVLFLRIDLGSFLALLGLLAAGAIATAFILRAVALRRSRANVLHVQREDRERHRQFIRRLDHEMKNPLTAVRAGLANLNGAAASPALTSVHSQIDRLARLTTDLRKLTDLETRSPETGPVDVGQLLAELVEEVTAAATAAANAAANEGLEPRQQRVILSLPRVPWPLPHVLGDRDLLFLACHNVLDNALKFSPPDAKIEVRAFEDGPMVAVEVADTGPGIAPEDLPHLGEELFRGRSALGVEGSGLGLALVSAIARQHGGAMSVRSRVGKGTVVTLRFPAGA